MWQSYVTASRYFCMGQLSWSAMNLVGRGGRDAGGPECPVCAIREADGQSEGRRNPCCIEAEGESLKRELPSLCEALSCFPE